MKKTTMVVSLLLVFICCKKNSTDPIQPLLEKFPQKWLLTTDILPDKYGILETAGNSMKRSEILKSYSLVKLAEERFCEFHVAQSRTEFTNEICYTLQLERERKRWLFTGNSSNLQEVHLRTTASSSETQDPGGDGYKFFIHNMPKVNGIKTVAIESVDKPGWYLSTGSPGFNYSPTQVILTKESSPEKATTFQCR